PARPVAARVPVHRRRERRALRMRGLRARAERNPVRCAPLRGGDAPLRAGAENRLLARLFREGAAARAAPLGDVHRCSHLLNPTTETRPMSAVAEVVHAKPHRVSLLETFSKKYDLEPVKMLDTLKGTAFKNPNGGPPITNEQMMALLVVANQYNLNPF